jgi:hypothetical protein
MNAKPSYLERVADYFKSRPGQSISCYELEKIGGRNGWRTRVSECRTRLGMRIGQPTHKRDPQTGVRTSFYRYDPPQPVSSLLDQMSA